LRVPVIDTSDLDIHSIEIPNLEDFKGEDLPKHLQFKFGVNYVNQLIHPSKIGKQEFEINEFTLGDNFFEFEP